MLAKVLAASDFGHEQTVWVVAVLPTGIVLVMVSLSPILPLATRSPSSQWRASLLLLGTTGGCLSRKRKDRGSSATFQEAPRE